MGIVADVMLLYIFFSYLLEMGSKKFLTLAELENILEDPNFWSDDDDDSPVDIVELPPENVDNVSDVEDIDDDILEDTLPNDVPGRLEIHSSTRTPANEITEESNLPSTSAEKPKHKKLKKEKISSDWQKILPDFQESVGDSEEILSAKSKIKESLKNKSCVEVFETLLDEEVLSHIVKQSVIYAGQNNRHGFSLSTDCLRKFVGFLLFTGYHSLPQEQLYWCEDPDMNIEIVRKCFSRNRYIEI